MLSATVSSSQNGNHWWETHEHRRDQDKQVHKEILWCNKEIIICVDFYYKMLIKEYRIPLPMTVEEYRIAQLYMIAKKSREESKVAN